MSTALEAITAFSATNIDDLVILMLLFARAADRGHTIQVVSGQFLGIAALVTISLSGLLCRATLPEAWIGLLGLLPISLGLWQLGERLRGQLARESTESQALTPHLAPLELAGVLGAASLTMANGSDNIGVYMPMFASRSREELLITLVVFALLTGLWCLAAWGLTRAPDLALPLRQLGDAVLPAVLIGIGGLILQRSHTLQNPALAALTLLLLAWMVTELSRTLQLLLRHRPLAGVQQP